MSEKEMTMKDESAVLIGALRQAVAGTQANFPAQFDWGGVLTLARAHHVEALVCDGLKKSPDLWAQVPEEVRDRLNRACMQAMYFDVQLDYIHRELQRRMCEANIRHIFLKGAVLKYSYPVPALRTMSDLDILVYADDFAALEAIAGEMGGQPAHSDGNHRNYFFPCGVTVEFHPNLLHHATPVGSQINPGWQYAREGEDCAAQLTEEMAATSLRSELATASAACAVLAQRVIFTPSFSR